MICPCFTAMSITLDLVTLCLVSFFQEQALRPEWPRQHLVQSHVRLCEHPGRCAWARHWLGLHGRRHCAALFESHNVLHRNSELGEAPGFFPWSGVAVRLTHGASGNSLFCNLTERSSFLVECRPSESKRSPAERDYNLFGATWWHAAVDLLMFGAARPINVFTDEGIIP